VLIREIRGSIIFFGRAPLGPGPGSSRHKVPCCSRTVGTLTRFASAGQLPILKSRFHQLIRSLYMMTFIRTFSQNLKTHLMKNIAVILSLALLASCSSGEKETNGLDAAKDLAAAVTDGATSAPATETKSDYKKYDIKSGIITFMTTMQIGDMIIKTKKVLYFDDYGIKECEEEYKENPVTKKEELAKRCFVKDGYNYTCSVENNGGIKSKAMGYGVAVLFNMDEAASLKDSKFKKLGDENVCEKPCNAFSMETPSGNITMFGWNRITLKHIVDNSSMKMKTETVAIKVEENAVIPADKFEVPAGVPMTDM